MSCSAFMKSRKPQILLKRLWLACLPTDLPDTDSMYNLFLCSLVEIVMHFAVHFCFYLRIVYCLSLLLWKAPYILPRICRLWFLPQDLCEGLAQYYRAPKIP